jgi:hypothetical protein
MFIIKFPSGISVYTSVCISRSLVATLYTPCGVYEVP